MHGSVRECNECTEACVNIMNARKRALLLIYTRLIASVEVLFPASKRVYSFVLFSRPIEDAEVKS